MTRTQYITVAELNEILGSAYTELIPIYEASEQLKYHMFDRLNSYDTSNAPDELKLATAYQVQFNESGIDDDYSDASLNVSIGKFSTSGTTAGGEYRKICPKAQRYLIDGGLLRRIL